MATTRDPQPESKGLRKKRRQIEYVLEQYKNAHPDVDPAILPHLIAPWAIKQGISTPTPQTPEEILRKDIARYLRNEYVDDKQGRHVRKNHAVYVQVQTTDGVKRRSRWYEKDVAPPDHMQLSLQLRRNAAFYDIRQMDLDWGSYNDNNMYGATLPPQKYDFTDDVKDSKMPTQYPAEPMGDDIDEEEEDEI